MSSIFFLMLLGSMLHVDFKKAYVAVSNLGVEGHDMRGRVFPVDTLSLKACWFSTVNTSTSVLKWCWPSGLCLKPTLNFQNTCKI